MTENVKTIEMKGIRLRVEEKEPEPFMVFIHSDTNDANFVDSITSYTIDEFFTKYLGGVFLLFEIEGRRFDTLKETINFFGGEYEFCQSLEIAPESASPRPHTVKNVEVIYTDLQKSARVEKDLNPIETRKEKVYEYLHRVSKEYGLDADEEQIERVMKELFK